MKKGKELTIKTPHEYNIRVGTVDNKNPKSIYINISSWVLPINCEYKNYNRVISNLSKKIKQRLYEILDKDRFYTDRTILSLDIRSSGISSTKKSFMDMEATLYQRVLDPVNSPHLTSLLKRVAENVITEVLDNEEDFIFSRKK